MPYKTNLAEIRIRNQHCRKINSKDISAGLKRKAFLSG
jgi:hypothetical protein